MPSGTFMFSAMAFGGQWIWTKTNRYRQNRILSTTPVESSSSSTSSAGKQGRKDDTVGTGLLNILPVHRTDVDDYEEKLKHKLQLIEDEQRALENEVERRKQVSAAAAAATATASTPVPAPAIENSANKDKSA